MWKRFGTTSKRAVPTLYGNTKNVCLTNRTVVVVLRLLVIGLNIQSVAIDEQTYTVDTAEHLADVNGPMAEEPDARVPGGCPVREHAGTPSFGSEGGE